jgi:hypothetical protein
MATKLAEIRKYIQDLQEQTRLDISSVAGFVNDELELDPDKFSDEFSKVAVVDSTNHASNFYVALEPRTQPQISLLQLYKTVTDVLQKLGYEIGNVTPGRSRYWTDLDVDITRTGQSVGKAYIGRVPEMTKGEDDRTVFFKIGKSEDAIKILKAIEERFRSLEGTDKLSLIPGVLESDR